MPKTHDDTAGSFWSLFQGARIHAQTPTQRETLVDFLSVVRAMPESTADEKVDAWRERGMTPEQMNWCLSVWRFELARSRGRPITEKARRTRQVMALECQFRLMQTIAEMPALISDIGVLFFSLACFLSQGRKLRELTLDELTDSTGLRRGRIRRILFFYRGLFAGEHR